MTKKFKTDVAIFEQKQVRRVWHEGKWWFVIIDVVAALTDSVQPDGYIKDMRRRDEELNKGWGQIATPLLVETSGGRQRINCANIEGIFRLIQSIPSTKAEPFKRWLARVGYERLEEIQNPELAMERIKLTYERKGYPKDWVDKRMRGIAVRNTLTDEWKNRGAESSVDYAILTNEIMEAAFDMDVDRYKKFKGLKRENLRDHMADLELILTMLGEATATKFTRDRNSNGLNKLKIDAREGGTVAGNARKEIEQKSGKKVSMRKNYLIKKRRTDLLK